MIIQGTRFGELELSDDARVLTLPQGIIGFPAEKRFVLLEPRAGASFAWLQSLVTPAIAFPVVDADSLSEPYPADVIQAAATAANFEFTELAIVVIIAVRSPEAPVANLLAPIVFDVPTLRGAQVVLDSRKYSPAERLETPPPGRNHVPSSPPVAKTSAI